MLDTEYYFLKTVYLYICELIAVSILTDFVTIPTVAIALPCYIQFRVEALLEPLLLQNVFAVLKSEKTESKTNYNQEMKIGCLFSSEIIIRLNYEII